MPTMIPQGVAKAKMNRSMIPFFYSSLSVKFLVIEMPSDMAAAGL